MSTGFLADLTISIVEKVGSKVTEHFIKKLRGWPTTNDEIGLYYRSIKLSAEQDLKSAEDTFQLCLSLLMRNKDLEMHGTIDRLRARVQTIRHDIEKTGSDIQMSAVKSEDVFRALSMILLTLQFEIFVVSNEVSKLNDSLEFGDEIKLQVKEIRDSIRNLDETWRLQTQASSDPGSAKALFKSLRQARSEWVDLIEGISSSSFGEMNKIMMGVVLSKPRFFGKKQYRESLADLIWQFGEHIDGKKIDQPSLIAKIQQDNPKVEFKDENFDEALKFLINSNRLYSMSIENNIKMVEFKKSDQSMTCGNCGKTGGIYEEFRMCKFLDKHLCDDCITFFKKCKICGNKIKEQHPKV